MPTKIFPSISDRLYDSSLEQARSGSVSKGDFMIRSGRWPLFQILISLTAFLTISGCSSSDSDTFIGGGEFTTDTVIGRVVLDEPVTGAEIAFEDLQGAPLSSDGVFSQTGGSFVARNVLLTPEFRVTATEAGNPQIAGQELNSSWSADGRIGPEAVIINAVTTLISAYRRAHPELSLAEAEARVKAYLGIPSEVDIRWQLDGQPSASFSHSAFREQAAAAGGVDSFIQQLVEEIDRGETRSIALDEEAGGFGTNVLAGIVGNITTGIVGDAVDFGFGQLASVLGWNFGTSAKLRQIANQLNQISTQIDELQTTVNEDAAAAQLTVAYNKVEDDISPLRAPNSTLIEQGQAADPKGVPASPIPGVQDLLATLGTLDAEGAIDNIGQDLMHPGGTLPGQDNVLAQLLAWQMLNAGVGPNVYEPVILSETIMAPLGSAFNYYSGWMTQAVSLSTESAFGTSGGQIAHALWVGAMDRQRKAQQYVKGWEIQIPQAMDKVVVDYGTGLMYWKYFEPSGTRDDAYEGQCTRQGFYGYNNWRLGHGSDLKKLHERQEAAHKQTGIATFATLVEVYGFVTSNFRGANPSGTSVSTGRVWVGHGQDNLNVCCAQGSDAFFDLETGTSSTADPDNSYPYMWVRTFPTDQGVSIEGNLRRLGTLTDVRVKDDGSGNVTAEGSFTISTPVATKSGTVSITDRIIWTSGNPQLADVSNLKGQEGTIQWRRTADNQQPSPVWIYASNYPLESADNSGNAQSFVSEAIIGKLLVTPPNVASRTVANLNITPMNPFIDSLQVKEQQFYLTAFGSDGFVEDVTAGNVTWSVTDLQGNPVTGIGFSPNTPGLLDWSGGPSAFELEITATYTFNGMPTTVKTKMHIPEPAPF